MNEMNVAIMMYFSHIMHRGHVPRAWSL